MDAEHFRSKGLLPFQAEFAHDFLKAGSPTCWELVAPPGTGHMRLAAAIAADMFESGSAKGVLVLGPAALLAAWCHTMGEVVSACKPQVVDRRTYLALQAGVSPGKAPWPSPAVILMSIDLAKRDDMVADLTSTSWDLVVVNESHLLRGRRRDLFEQMRRTEATPRMLLFTATPKEEFSGIRRRAVDQRAIFDWDGNPVFPQFRRELQIIDYERTEAEHAFLGHVVEFAGQLGQHWPYGKAVATTMLRIASSSIDATERALHRLQDAWRPMRNKLAHGVPWTAEDFEQVERQLDRVTDEPVVVEELPPEAARDPRAFLALYQDLERLLESVSDVGNDSKVEALADCLREFTAKRKIAWVCVWTSFVATAEFLSSCLEEEGRPVFCITGAAPMALRIEQQRSFRETGGVLITTDVSSEGAQFEYVDICINYDLPWNPEALEQRWGRFLRLGRQRPFVMVALRDLSKPLAWEEDLFQTVEKVLSAGDQSHTSDCAQP